MNGIVVLVDMFGRFEVVFVVSIVSDIDELIDVGFAAFEVMLGFSDADNVEFMDGDTVGFWMVIMLVYLMKRNNKYICRMSRWCNRWIECMSGWDGCASICW
eukprot:510875_1